MRRLPAMGYLYILLLLAIAVTLEQGFFFLYKMNKEVNEIMSCGCDTINTRTHMSLAH
ncbi:MAG: hypothetical protein ABUT20_06785 [Bacteroidota bacterium]